MVIKAIIMALIAIGEWAQSLLPDHTPLELPDPVPVFNMLAGFAAYDRWVSLPLLLLVVGLILIFELAYLLYWVYRVVLGFIPMFK